MVYQVGALEALKSVPAGIWFLFALPLIFAEIAVWQTGNSRHYLLIFLSAITDRPKKPGCLVNGATVKQLEKI